MARLVISRKSAVNRTQSRRSARFADARQTRSAWTADASALLCQTTQNRAEPKMVIACTAVISE